MTARLLARVLELEQRVLLLCHDARMTTRLALDHETERHAATQGWTERPPRT